MKKKQQQQQQKLFYGRMDFPSRVGRSGLFFFSFFFSSPGDKNGPKTHLKRYFLQKNFGKIFYFIFLKKLAKMFRLGFFFLALGPSYASWLRQIKIMGSWMRLRAWTPEVHSMI